MSKASEYLQRIHEAATGRSADTAGSTAQAAAAPADHSSEYLQLIDPMAAARIGHLEMLSMRVVDGFLSGKHRSTHKGGCFEFAEHRAYAPGDEIRLIDWRVYAKSDRYYLKLFDEETNLQVIMVVDASGSMQFGHSTISKGDYAKMACACLSRLMLRQRDAVGLAMFDSQVRQFVPPRSNASHLQPILRALCSEQPDGETSLPATLHEVARRLKSRGLVIVFSDCFGDLESIAKALQQLRLRGHDLLLFHTMAPEELFFSFQKWSRFECLETHGLGIDLDPISVRKKYLERVQQFVTQLKRDCTKIGCDYELLRTDQHLGDSLATYLTRRTARSKK